MAGRFFEHYQRVKQYYRFSKVELNSLLIVILVTGFIFSMQHPGEELSLFNWLKYFIYAVILAAMAFFLRLSLQKIFALDKGYYAEFKIWWEGLAASLVLSFLSLGYLPLILVGGINSIFMVRQRLGEFRYGYSYEENAVIALWGMVGNLYLATMFALLNMVFPGTFLFSTGMVMNIVMAICFLLPLPWLEGLQIFFGWRFIYYVCLATWLLVTLLLLSGTKIGLIIVIIGGALFGIFRLLWAP